MFVNNPIMCVRKKLNYQIKLILPRHPKQSRQFVKQFSMIESRLPKSVLIDLLSMFWLRFDCICLTTIIPLKMDPNQAKIQLCHSVLDVRMPTCFKVRINYIIKLM